MNLVRKLCSTKIKSLDSSGIGHHALIALLVISTIAGFGAYRVWSSSASTVYRTTPMSTTTQEGCDLTGRKWIDGKCSTTCIKTTDKFIAGNDQYPSGYCPGAINHLTLAQCTETGRRWVYNTGCTRQLNQADGKYSNSKHCIDSSASYTIPGNMCACPADTKRNLSTGRCVSITAAPAPTTTTTPTTTPTTTATPTVIDSVMCAALGRVYDATKKVCTANCLAGAGSSITHQNGTRYCDRAVLVNSTESRCAEVHRRWTPAGCARRADQKDIDNDYIRCVGEGYRYYDTRLMSDNTSGLDVCEKSATSAAANLKAGFAGSKADGTPICDDAKKVLSADKKFCVTPTSGSAASGGQSTPTTGATGATADQKNNITIDGEYRIVLYKDKDFKGDQLAVVATVKDGTVSYRVSSRIGSQDAKPLSPMPKTLSEMPSGWNDAASSYRILSGRWRLCPDASYKTTARLNCVSPYASDTDLNSGNSDKYKLDNQISSLRPIVETVQVDAVLKDESGNPVLAESGDTVPVMPGCPNDAAGKPQAIGDDGKCPGGAPPTCPTGLVLKEDGCKEKVYSADIVVAVDKSMSKRDCELLGREYIAKPGGGKTTNGGQYGCSLYTCERDRDGAPRYSGDEKNAICISSQFNAAYAVAISEKACNDLHRVWIKQVRRCAQEPNRKDKNQTIVKSERCKSGSYSTYYIFKANQKDDECFKPSYFQKARSAAKSVGGGLNSALKQGPKAFCNTVKRGNYHWNGKKCVIDRKTCWNGASIAVTKECPPPPAPSVDSGPAPDGSPTGGVPTTSNPGNCARFPDMQGCDGYTSYSEIFCDDFRKRFGLPKGAECFSTSMNLNSCYDQNTTSKQEGKTIYWTQYLTNVRDRYEGSNC